MSCADPGPVLPGPDMWEVSPDLPRLGCLVLAVCGAESEILSDQRGIELSTNLSEILLRLSESITTEGHLVSL